MIFRNAISDMYSACKLYVNAPFQERNKKPGVLYWTLDINDLFGDLIADSDVFREEMFLKACNFTFSGRRSHSGT